MSLKTITAPIAEPLSMEEVKLHLRLDGNDEDSYIQGLMMAARLGAERITRRVLMSQTLELTLDRFPHPDCHRVVGPDTHKFIAIPRPPFVAIEAVNYLDESGVLQPLSEQDYLLDTHSEPARLSPAFGKQWPITRRQVNAVVIRYKAGYEDATKVPQEIKNWMLLRIGMLYENRESVVVGASVKELPFVDGLLDDYRIWGV